MEVTENSNNTETPLLDQSKLEEIKSVESFKDFVDIILAGEKVDFYLDAILKELLEKERENESTEKESTEKVADQINSTSSPIKNTKSIFFELSTNPSPSLLSKFFYNNFLELNLRAAINQNPQMSLKHKIHISLNHLINLMKHYKKSSLLSISKSIRKLAIDNLFSIDLIFMKDFISLFDLKDKLFSEKENALIFSIINNLIETASSPKSLNNILKIVDFFLKYIADEKIVFEGEPSQFSKSANQAHSVESKINFRSILQMSLEDKSLYNITKRVLRIVPQEVEEVIRFYLSINETKQPGDLIKEFSQFVSEDLRREIINLAYKKSLNFHYYRYFNYEIDIGQLVELFVDKPAVMTHLANRFCKDNLLHECYFVLKLFNFDLNVIVLEENYHKIMINFLMKNLLKGTIKKSNKLDSTFLSKFADNENVNIYVEDFFGPLYKSCIQIDLDISNVIFVDKIEDLNKLTSLAQNEILGIDFEWRSPPTTLEKDNGASIVQIATREQVFIFDLFKLEGELFDKFAELFSNKTFLGFNYKGDMSSLRGSVKKFFTSASSEDITEIYSKKFNIACPSLSECCKQILKKELCKAEQISNWEKRPLRLRQLHYAALDAHILLKVYDKLQKLKSFTK